MKVLDQETGLLWNSTRRELDRAVLVWYLTDRGIDVSVDTLRGHEAGAEKEN